MAAAPGTGLHAFPAGGYDGVRLDCGTSESEEPAMIRPVISIIAVVSMTTGLRAEDLKAPEVGDDAPPLGLETLLQAPEGAVANWEALKGKVVVVEFWATWCGPCVGAIPHLNELAEKFKDKPVRFISVTDEKQSVISKFLKKRKMRSWVGLDTDKSMHRAYGITTIPHTFLVDKNGKIAADTAPHRVTEGALNKMLEGEPPGIPSTPHGEKIVAGVEPGGKLEPALFQVSIRPSRFESGGTSWYRDKMTARAAQLPQLIAMAYGARATRLVDKASLPDNRYDVVIVMPKGHEDQLTPFFRQALESTFGFSTRKEMQEREVFVLSLSKNGYGKGMQPSASTGGSSTRSGYGKIEAVNQDVDYLVGQLEYLLKRPVVDKTQLGDRKFDIRLSFDDEEQATIIAAVKNQLGIEISPLKDQVEMFLIEKADR